MMVLVTFCLLCTTTGVPIVVGWARYVCIGGVLALLEHDQGSRSQDHQENNAHSQYLAMHAQNIEYNFPILGI